MRPRLYCVLLLALFIGFINAVSGYAQSTGPKALLEETAKAMGGLQALKALKNQVVESEGKQFDSSSTLRRGGPTRQISTFRYTLTRDLAQPRLTLQWEAKNLGDRPATPWQEVIDGSVGLLRDGAGASAKESRLHPARLATRMREEKRAAAKIIPVALGQKNLRRLANGDLDGKPQHVVAFQEGDDEFRLYLDAKTKLPTQVEIMEADPLEGDSRFTLRYSDWRKVDAVMLPFALRFELNGKPLQEEQIKSLRHNVALGADTFAIPQAIRGQKSAGKPIASQWLLRRVAGYVGYAELGREPRVEFSPMAEGVHRVGGSSHNTIVVEMRDHLVAVEGPLFEDRTAAVVKAIKERFPAKPIRYVIPTHHHLDHAGGIRAFMAEGATLVVPFNATEFYERVAKAPHTIRPDSLGKKGVAVMIESYGGGYRELTDGNQRVEIHPLPTSHAEDNQVIYLPRAKILIEADHVSPRKGQVGPSARVREFVQAVDKLNLDILTVAGIHGDAADMQAVRATAKGGKR